MDTKIFIKWIGRCPHFWDPRFPDLTPMNFFVWMNAEDTEFRVNMFLTTLNILRNAQKSFEKKNVELNVLLNNMTNVYVFLLLAVFLNICSLIVNN